MKRTVRAITLVLLVLLCGVVFSHSSAKERTLAGSNNASLGTGPTHFRSLPKGNDSLVGKVSKASRKAVKGAPAINVARSAFQQREKVAPLITCDPEDEECGYASRCSILSCFCPRVSHFPLCQPSGNPTGNNGYCYRHPTSECTNPPWPTWPS